MKKTILLLTIVLTYLLTFSILSVELKASTSNNSSKTKWFEFDLSTDNSKFTLNNATTRSTINTTSKKQTSKFDFQIFVSNDDIKIILNNGYKNVFIGKAYFSSQIYRDNIWIDVEVNSSNIDILTVDLIKSATSDYVLESEFSQVGKTIARLVYIDRKTNKVNHVTEEISLNKFEQVHEVAEDIIIEDSIFTEYRDSVLLNYPELMIEFPVIEDGYNKEYFEIKGDFTDPFITTLNATTKYDTWGELFIPSLNLTITEWMPSDYYLDSIFPTIDILPKLIDNYSYGNTKLLANNHYLFIKEYAWINALYPTYTNIIYMEYELQGAADSLIITLKFADFYRYFSQNRTLVYTGPSDNAWLEDFYFRLSADKPINYIKISKAGLWEWPSFTPFNTGQATMNAVFSLGGSFSLGTVETILSTFTDEGGFASSNDEYTVEQGTFIYDQFNIDPINERELSFVIDPKWIMRIESPSKDHTQRNSRWKQFSIDIRYQSITGDTPALEYRHIVNFKRHAIYSAQSSNKPFLDLTMVGGTIAYIVPVGC